ncbi:MAG: hypothetical protein MUP13_05350 [Thermoanaerobaculales bacterium]|nr:hypothetical protein [Thermoanaerobaculales bacterium]
MSTRPVGILTVMTVIVMAVEAAIAIALAVPATARDLGRQQSWSANRNLVRELGLTDLALSGGTSYTRHPSQADLFAPHNEHPAAIEHFPAGSVVQPPADAGPALPGAPNGGTP